MRRHSLARCSIALAALLGALLFPGRASAIPYFAHEYALTCQKCHTVVPHLNDFGLEFMDRGYSLPGATPLRVFPLSARTNLLYTSDPAPGFPKAIVDELEVFLAGTASGRTNYFIEQYLVDGGAPGLLRDAWLQYRFTPNGAKVPLYAQAGQFTLPVPVDPETFRDTYADYAVFVQAVGDNAFDFFEPKDGLQLRGGYADHGLSLHLAALQGHDQQSGVPSMGIDRMEEAQETIGPVALSLYRYDGSRPDRGLTDRFWRQGYGLTILSGNWTSESVLQTGADSTFLGRPAPVLSSGGFTQLRYDFDRRLFGLVRYDATNDPSHGLYRDVVPLLGYRTTRNARATVEDLITHVPRTIHTLNLQYTVAY